MNIAICDDMEWCCNVIEKYVSDYFAQQNMKTHNIYIFHSGEEILASEELFDIVFLDMKMPGIDGCETAKRLKERNRRTIFMVVSGYPNCIDDAMRVEVFRFLTKPLEEDRFLKNFKDAIRLYNTRTRKVAIEMKGEVQVVFSSDIVMIEAVNRKVYVRTMDGDYLSVHNMQYWAETLGGLHFFQSHRNYIVNLEHVVHFSERGIDLDHNNYTAYMTFRKYKAFKEAYLLYYQSIM